MSKTISEALTQHLAGEVTTLATLWKVKRRDGQIFGFTDHDRDIAYDDGAGDGPITYVARSGYTRSAIERTADLAVDNLDVETFFDAADITEEDLRAGRWDQAEVRLMLVNRADLGQGHLALRRGFLGEVTITDGSFACELRGLTQALQQTIGEVYTPDCPGRPRRCPLQGRSRRHHPEHQRRLAHRQRHVRHLAGSPRDPRWRRAGSGRLLRRRARHLHVGPERRHHGPSLPGRLRSVR